MPRKSKAQLDEERWDAWLANADARSSQLQSVTDALHDELDKLNKKWPEKIVSDLMVQKANKIIVSVKELLKPEPDEFVDEIDEFIPAGDNPESRDVVLVIAQIQAGLRRFRSAHNREWLGL